MRRVVSRTLQSIVVMFGITTVMFLLLRAVPGDPAAVIAGPNATPAVLSAIRAQYHLNEPIVDQYGHWIASVLSGNLGTSMTYQVPVTTLVRQAIGPTLQLLVAAMFIGVSLGVLPSIHRVAPAERMPMTSRSRRNRSRC